MDYTIYPCLWFNGEAKEAATFYCSLFSDSKIITDTPMVVNFELNGQKFMGLNGGAQFKFNPSISFFIVCESEEETNAVWKGLSDGGKELMPLDKYDWSEKYGWVQDRFGISWQVSLGKMQDVGQKFTPLLMFTGKHHGLAERAIQFYTETFQPSSVDGILKYKAGEEGPEGTVKHAQFRLKDYVMMVMDSSFDHGFDFNEAISFVVTCKDQAEIDFYWNRFTKDGEEGRCGWCKDPFGVSWQVVPEALGTLMKDPARSGRVIQAFMQMKKFNIQQLEEA
jgi:predicted 3-demethylubiquinone-9 3-methyltransferase (glyoxalase superfamily)